LQVEVAAQSTGVVGRYARVPGTIIDARSSDLNPSSAIQASNSPSGRPLGQQQRAAVDEPADPRPWHPGHRALEQRGAVDQDARTGDEVGVVQRRRNCT